MDLTFIAAEDLSAKQYYLVEFAATEGQVQLHDTANKYALGVLRNKPESGETAVVRVLGVTEAAVEAGGVTYGDSIGDDVPAAPTGLIGAKGAGEAVYGFVINASGTTAADLATVMVDFITPKIYTALS
jgi:hypothetical protein